MSYIIVKVAQTLNDDIPMKASHLPQHIGTIKSSYATIAEANADLAKLKALNPDIEFAVIRATK